MKTMIQPIIMETSSSSYSNEIFIKTERCKLLTTLKEVDSCLYNLQMEIEKTDNIECIAIVIILALVAFILFIMAWKL